MVGLDDVGVNQVSHQTGFTDKIVLKFGDGGVFLADQFNSHSFTELAGASLTGLEYNAHTTVGDFADHLVVEFVEYVFEGAHVEMRKP
jgi:hypothetical protein